DFLLAPFFIQEFYEGHGTLDNVMQVKYEDIVAQPEENVRKIYEWLEIPFSDDVLMIGRNEKVRGIYGDDVYRKQPKNAITHESTDAWRKTILANKELFAFFAEYQAYLSDEFIGRYGYERNDFRV